MVTTAVRGDPGLSVLKVLGVAQDASPVGAAARGDGGVATGVWCAPKLYLARWANGRRRVTGYELGSTGKPNDYIRVEGRIPTRFETDNWYGEVPEAVADAFIAVDMFVDDPPFAVPAAPPTPPPVATRSTSSGTRTAREPRAPRRAAEPKPPPAPTTRVCASCYLHKKLAQFRAGSDICADCD